MMLYGERQSSLEGENLMSLIQCDTLQVATKLSGRSDGALALLLCTFHNFHAQHYSVLSVSAILSFCFSSRER